MIKLSSVKAIMVGMDVWQSQNFINNPRLVASLLDLTDVNRSDLVIEVGSGTGAITKQLAERAGTVIAVERDINLASKIQYSNVQVVTGDFLNYQLPKHSYKVVANIPFNLTADIVRKLFMGYENPPVSAYLIMQEEAAKKFTGKPKATLVSTLLEVSFAVSNLSRIGRKSFVPVPKVNAAFVAFIKRSQPLVEKEDMKEFRDFVTYGYVHSQRKRPILNSFDKLFTPAQREILDGKIDIKRVEIGDANMDHWISMFEAFKKLVPKDRKVMVRGAMTRLEREQSQLPKVHRTRRF